MKETLPLCRFCGSPFQPTREWNFFCKSECRLNYHERERKLAMQARKDKVQR